MLAVGGATMTLNGFTAAASIENNWFIVNSKD